jgi:hypothetical protein
MGFEVGRQEAKRVRPAPSGQLDRFPEGPRVPHTTRRTGEIRRHLPPGAARRPLLPPLLAALELARGGSLLFPLPPFLARVRVRGLAVVVVVEFGGEVAKEGALAPLVLPVFAAAHPLSAPAARFGPTQGDEAPLVPRRHPTHLIIIVFIIIIVIILFRGAEVVENGQQGRRIPPHL